MKQCTGGAGDYYWQVDLGPDPDSGKNKMAHGYVETLQAQTMIGLCQRAGTHQLRRHRGPRSPLGSGDDTNTCGPV